MNITAEDAKSLLRKWQEERRVIQVGLIASTTTGAHIIGRIVRIDDILRIDATSLNRTGERFALVLDFSEALEFRFEDWRDAPPEFRDQIRDVCESQLFIELASCRCELFALKTKAELSPLDTQ